MTHQLQTTALDQITELLAENGFDGLAQAVTVLLNEVMKIERPHALGAGPYQRADDRKGYANGFKSRTIRTRIGALTVQVPQTRGVAFSPSTLEKGIRSERALKLAVAEMYVQGVSTRRVSAIVEGGEPPGGPVGLRPAASPSPPAADDERGGATEPGAEAADPGRGVVPGRGFAASAGQRRGDGDQ